MSSNERDSVHQLNGSGQNSSSHAESDCSMVSSPVKSDGSEGSFEHVYVEEAIEGSNLKDVIVTLRNKQYNIKDVEDGNAESKCHEYFKRDYVCRVVDHGKACENYPAALIVPVALKRNINEKDRSTIFDSSWYTTLATKAICARIRDRFPVPVILFEDKYICRSGTLTCRKTAAYVTAVKLQGRDTEVKHNAAWEVFSTVCQISQNVMNAIQTLVNFNFMKDLFKDDMQVLQYLRVKHVIDLMVEYRKTYKDYFNVSSCELMNMDIYRDMKINDLPFPGCEFFKTYNEANRNPEGLNFDWSGTEVKRELNLFQNLGKLIPEIDQAEMKEWDLVQLTKNYLMILLAVLVKNNNDGILIHCISGWDRTPLFISLLRLSLWADGVIHPSLNSEEMAYLTVTYDWYLFGHNLPDRLQKGEEIMHFCFNFLPYVATDEFSITKMFERLPADERGNREFPQYRAGREEALKSVSQLVLDAYQEHIIQRSKK